MKHDQAKALLYSLLSVEYSAKTMVKHRADHFLDAFRVYRSGLPTVFDFTKPNLTAFGQVLIDWACDLADAKAANHSAACAVADALVEHRIVGVDANGDERSYQFNAHFLASARVAFPDTGITNCFIGIRAKNAGYKSLAVAMTEFGAALQNGEVKS